MALAWLGEENRPGAEGWDATRADMIEMAKECKKNGITFLYHNHDFEFEKLDGKYKLEVIYDTIPADLLQSELDTCWVNVGGENPADYVRKYAGRCEVVHLHRQCKGGPESGIRSALCRRRRTGFPRHYQGGRGRRL